jgi:hypothetical protein
MNDLKVRRFSWPRQVMLFWPLGRCPDGQAGWPTLVPSVTSWPLRRSMQAPTLLVSTPLRISLPPQRSPILDLGLDSRYLDDYREAGDRRADVART